jgi:hypothetical protein
LKLPLFPLRGFINAVLRQDIPLNALTGPSLNWLVGRNRYRRRAGTALVENGILPTKWAAKARRAIAAVLRSITDGFPAPMFLLTNESTKSATLSWKDSTTASWRTVGDDFSASTYPDAALPTHRVVPMVYENEYGGITLHRLNTAEYRQHMAAGSRDIQQSGFNVCWPGYNSAPTRWLNTGTANEVYPLGMIPPLGMPICSKGNLTFSSGATVGPWKGSNAFYFSILFENDKGELSMFTLPRPPGSAWLYYEGFGYKQIDSANPTLFYDSVVYSEIPDGPPGTRWKHLLRSTKVDVASTGAGAIVQPAISDMNFFARIPQGQKTYVDIDGNDLSLDSDPRVVDIWSDAGLAWPPRARSMGRFDGHYTLGNLRPNPYAVILAPWDDGLLNLQADDASLYGATSYFVSIQPTSAIFRSVTGGTATDKTVSIAGMTLRGLCDRLLSESTTATVTLANCFNTTNPAIFKVGSRFVYRATAFAGVAIGDVVVAPSYFPTGSTVTLMDGPLGSGAFAGKYRLQVSFGATDHTPIEADGGASFSFDRYTSDLSKPWVAQVVPGADADETCESLLRTYVSTVSTYSAASTSITVTAAQAPYITPGMLVYRTSAFSAGTVVTAVSGTTVTISPTSLSATGSGGAVVFAYDTGDTTLALLPGYVRTFGNAFPMVCPWNKTYLDRFEPDHQASTFSAASPGYAQDGVNTWMVRNRRGGPANFGQFMGMADLGPDELQFYTKGRMRLYNPRTGLTRADEDYAKVVASWNRGARSPYAICSGNAWAIFLSDEGFFVCSGGEEERLISLDIYNAEMQEGSRGELEYAVKACIVASDSDTDDYKIHAQVRGGVLSVRYHSSASAAYPDREIRYDFSGSVGRSGIAEVLRSDGSPYPWSTPLTLRHSCSISMAQADGDIWNYAAVDSNSHATKDGRVDRIDVGTADVTTAVTAIGYTGLYFPPDMNEIQPTMAYVDSTKAGEGLSISLARDPEALPDESAWDSLEIPTSGIDSYGRSVRWLKPEARRRRSAVEVKIYDDGTGTCPEVSNVMIEASEVTSTTGDRRRGGV